MKTGIKEKILQVIEEINVEDDFILDDIEKNKYPIGHFGSSV